MRLQDLKRGMRCTLRDGKSLLVEGVIYECGKVLFYEDELPKRLYLDDNLADKTCVVERDVMTVEDATVDGFKVIWEREEPKKYYLRLPREIGGAVEDKFLYLNYHREVKKYLYNAKAEDEMFQTKFTQEEIDEIDTTFLVLEEVEEE